MASHALVCLALFAVATAVPASLQFWEQDDSLDSYACATECPGTSKFQYKPGTTYYYDYIVDTDTTMAGATQDSAKLSIQTRAEIQVIDNCEMALKLQNVKIFHSDSYTGEMIPAARKDEFRRALESNMLRFAYLDGIITSICPEKDDSIWALNFKRGLLSAFQTSKENFDSQHAVREIDVSGECLTEYSNEKARWIWDQTQTTIIKQKNMTSCSHRSGVKTFLQITPYDIPSAIQSVPVLSSTQKCQYIMDNAKFIKSATCEEIHVNIPFSNHESGGRTIVKQNLSYKQEKETIDIGKGPVGERRSLLFEYFSTEDKPGNNREAAEQKLKELCEQTRDSIRSETPKLYTELVSIMKHLEGNDLEDLHESLKDKSICPQNDRTIKFFLDALPMTGGAGSINLMTSLVNKNEVSTLTAKAWLTTLAFIQEPTSTMFKGFSDLLKGPNSEAAILPVSALLGKYCEIVPTCEYENDVSSTVKAIQNKIPYQCKTTDKILSGTLKTLKAIGNTGLMTDTLNTCLTSTASPLEVRIAAADAHRRVSCDKRTGQSWETMWSIVNDSSEDHELRISCYLGVMRCSTKDTLEKVTHILSHLSSSDDEQLGSFIASHLKNLKATSDPLKQDLAKAVKEYTFKEFDHNPIKYSNNYEASFLINRLNMGLTAESNVILDTKPVPRSAMLNLTLHLFGNSINALEFGGRTEGLEILVDWLSHGFFPNKSGKKNANDVKGSIYARIFGKEILFEHGTLGNGVNGGKIPNFLELLMKLANKQDVLYTHSQKIMDATLVFPTGAGLPLGIHVNGSFTLDLKAEGKADLRKISTPPRSLDIEGELKPSAALEISVTMGIDAHIAKMGLRMRNTLHSATGIKGRIQVNRGSELSVQIDPPKDQMEIFNARSEFFIVHNDVEKHQDMITENRKEYKLCSGDKLAKVIGVELCADLQFPNASYHTNSPYFPLTGPSSISFVMHKRDTHSSYKLLAKAIKKSDFVTAQFLMNTPNSKIDRMISTDLTITYSPEQHVDVVILSPWKRFNLNSALMVNKEIISAGGSILIDDTDKYGLTAEMKVNDYGKRGLVLTPYVKLIKPECTDILLSGEVNYDFPKAVDAKLEIGTIYNKPLTFKGSAINNHKEKRLSVSLSQKGQDDYQLRIGSVVERNGKNDRNINIKPELIVKTPQRMLVNIFGSWDYKPDKTLRQGLEQTTVLGDLTMDLYKMKPTTFSLNAKKLMKKKQVRYDIDFKLKSSLVTGNVDSTIFQRKNSIASKVKVNYNIPSIGRDVLLWNTKLNDRSKNFFKKYTFLSNLDSKKNPDYNAGIKFDVGHKRKQSTAELTLKYGPNPKDKKKMIMLTTSLSHDVNNLMNAVVDLKLDAQAPSQDIDFNMKMSHSHAPGKLNSKLNLKFEPFLKDAVEADINLSDKSNKLTRLVGQANLEAGGRKVLMKMDLTQKSAKQYEHSLDVTDSITGKHAITTLYRIPSDEDYQVITNLISDSFKPFELQGKASLNPRNLLFSSSARLGKEIYSLSTQSKLAKENAGKWNLDIVTPFRQIEVEVQGKNVKGKYDGTISLDWNASKQNSKSKIVVEGAYRHSSAWDTRIINGDLRVITPFEKYESLVIDVGYNSDASQYSSKGKVSWGGKQDSFTLGVVTKHPLTLQNVHIMVSATTPFRQYREVDFEIDHRMDLVFDSTMKGKLGDQTGELSVKGENKGTANSRDFYGIVDLKIPFTPVRSLNLFFQHKDNGRTYKTSGSVEQNGKKYDGKLEMDHWSYDDKILNNGDLIFQWHGDSLETSWKHQSTYVSDIESSFESKWNHGHKNIKVSLKGTSTADDFSQHVWGHVNIQTPWKNSREVAIKFDHMLNQDKLTGSGEVISSREQKILYEFSLQKFFRAGNAKFMVKSPLYEHRIQAHTIVNFSQNPAIANAWVEWAPLARMEFDSSLNAQSMVDVDLNVKLTTPFSNLENIILKASHKFENAEYISHGLIDYGVRKMIDFENHFRDDFQVTFLRTKLTTPCPYLATFHSGMRIEKKSAGFEAAADFELMPLIKKYDGFISLDKVKKDFNGKLHIHTPHAVLPSLQITVWSKQNDDLSRTSHIGFEPTSLGLYSFDTTYRTSLPYHLDMKLKSPHPKLNDVGVTAWLNPSDNSLQSILKVVYLPRKEINSELKLLWSNKYEGSLVIETPFKSYENNKLFARHDITYKGYTTHGEVSVGGRYAQADIVYTATEFTKTGSASLITPIPDYEKLALDFNMQGRDLSQLRGETSLTLGKKRLSTSFSNNYKSGSVKSSIALVTPYTQDLKMSVKHEYTSSYDNLRCESTFDGSYGSKQTNGKIAIAYAGLKDSSVEISLNTLIKSFVLSLSNVITESNISGKGTIKTDIAVLGITEFSYSKSGSLDNMVAMANMIRNGENMFDALIETQKPGDEIHGKIVMKGKLLPALTAQMDHKGDFTNFNTKAHLSGSGGKMFDNEIRFKIDGNIVDVTGQMNYRLGQEDHTHVVTIHKEGILSHFRVDVSKKHDGEEMNAKLRFEAGEKIKGLIELDNISGQYNLISAELEHSGNLDNFLTSGKVILNKDTISGKVSFYKYLLQRIEIYSELNTPWKDFKVQYRHEGQDNRFNCNLNIDYGQNKKISTNLIMQSDPVLNMSLNVKTPFKDYEELIISGSYDDSKANGMAVLGKGTELTVTGQFDPSVYPYHPRFQITTSFDFLKKVTLNMKGQPLDGTVDLSFVSFGRKVDLNGELKYSNLYTFSLSGQLVSNIKHLEMWRVTVRNAEDAYNSKTTHLEISWDVSKQIVVDGLYLSQYGSQNTQLKLDIKLSSDKLKTVSLTSDYISEISRCEAILGFELNNDKLLGVDLMFEKGKYSTTALIQKPWPMEYSASYNHDDYYKGTEIFVNWDRNEATSNIRFIGNLRTSPSKYSTDRTMELSLVSPSRTVGIEHFYTASDDKLSSSGKLFWDQDDNSKLSYSLDVNGNNRRGARSYDGLFKLGLPTRTLGFSGSVSNNEVNTKTDASFSWDMDRDGSKQIGFKAIFSGMEYTKADISLQLPQNFQVDSSLILNQGNTLFDGKTDISYSRDAHKTLTLYSKVKNVPDYRYFPYNENFFNYSIELGVSHPETNIDVKIDTHIGKSSELLTSSLGVEYLTVMRQKKNVALFAEINKLRKEINLLVSTPTSSIGINSKLKPLNLEVQGFVDAQKKFESTLEVDSRKRVLKFKTGQPDNLVSLIAFYPNNSAIQAELNHITDYQNRQASLLTVCLMAPNVIHNKIQWRPELAQDLKHFVTEQASISTELVKRTLQQLNQDVLHELAGKYRDITSSVVDHLNPLLRLVESELESFGQEIDAVNKKLGDMHKRNEFHMKDISTYAINNFKTASGSFIILRDELHSLSNFYHVSYKNVISSISTILEYIKEYPLADVFHHLMSQAMENLLKDMAIIVQYINEVLKADLQLLELHKTILVKLGESAQLDQIQNKIEKLQNFDYGTYIDSLSMGLKNGVENLQSLNWKRYMLLLHSIQDRLLPEYVKDASTMAFNEVYQQSKWAYDYWNVEENLKKTLIASVELLKEIIHQEQKELLDTFTGTDLHIFQSGQGKLEFDLHLPFKVNSSDSLPDFQSFIDQVSEVYQKYGPDNETFSKYTPYFNLWPSHETSDDFNQEFERDQEEFEDSSEEMDQLDFFQERDYLNSGHFYGARSL